MARSASYLFSVLVLALNAVISVEASAVPLVGREVRAAVVKRDVWVPAVISPTEGTVWRVGETVQVTWSTENPPSEITNPNGMVVLRTTNGFVQGAGGLAEPLAGNFSLFDGEVNVQVPEVPARDDYQVVLFGDSGNESPFFTISNPMLAPIPGFGPL